jgi:acyl carrier protein
MTREEIEEKTLSFLAEEFEVERDIMKLDAPLKETLGLDSLDFVDLVVFIESHFGFKVKTEDFQGMITFKDFYDYIENQLIASQLKS